MTIPLYPHMTDEEQDRVIDGDRGGARHELDGAADATCTIPEDDVEAVLDCLRSRLADDGPADAAFEEAFAEFVGAPHAVAVSSGTAALHLACVAAGLGPGDEVDRAGIDASSPRPARSRYTGADARALRRRAARTT